MNKTIKSVGFAIIVIACQNVMAYTNKTFLQPRNQALTNLPLEMSSFSERIYSDLENRWGFNFEAIGFYGQSTNKREIGQYFGICNYNDIPLFRGQDPLFLTMTNGMFDIGYLIHDTTASPVPHLITGQYPETTISLHPKSVNYGVDFVYYHDLSKLVKGLYFKVNLPIECVQNNPNLSVSGGDYVATPVPGHLATKANIFNFFKGNQIEGQPAIDTQLPLTAGKINGKQSATGIADIDVMLGYKFLDKENKHASINIGFNIPTGKKSTGEYMFEPIYGTPSFGLGCGIEASKRIWGNEKINFKVNAAANYRYLFQATEHRIPGIDNDNFGQYELLAQANKSIADPIILQPAANILNHKVKVTMGSQIDAIFELVYNYNGFTLNLGYNFYHREGEQVKQAGAIFPKKTYGTASKGLVVSGPTSGTTTAVGLVAADNQADVFGSTLAGPSQFDDDSGSTSAWLSDKFDLNFGAATTPTQLTNGIYAGTGYAFTQWRCPLMLGIGGKYEFASKNSALELWQIHVKTSLSF